MNAATLTDTGPAAVSAPRRGERRRWCGAPLRWCKRPLRWCKQPLRWCKQPLRWCGLALSLGLLCGPASAGNQKEEALADAVRVALSTAIRDARPPQPSFRDPAERGRYESWLLQMSERLRRKLPDNQVRIELLQVVWYEARRAGLDPAMVLGLIQVESAYRKYAVSMAGARGYMQVMPFWTAIIGDSDRSKLFNMQTNLRYGCAILRMYLDMEAGNLFLALGRYNGSRGRPEYPNAVLAAWKNWTYTPPT